MRTRALYLLALALLTACSSDPSIAPATAPNPETEATTALAAPPAWAKEAIWYEVSLERFRNGDATNDQTAADIAGTYPGFVPPGWTTTPWTQDWYRPDAYFAAAADSLNQYGNRLTNFADFAQLRRYGGDLQGFLDRIDYLDRLGVTAVYFRPINDSPSLHKYDARNWRHVDANFGPDPAGDRAIMAAETPDDPSTWRWTAADRLFLQTIEELHARDMRLIIDYSWNHTGNTFWAWQDVLKNQAASKYRDWYWIESFDDPATPENEFAYHGWLGVISMPEIRETARQDLSQRVAAFEGNIYSPAAKRHILNVAARWLDPNGDGDPADGIDGYRLDVAAETPLGFWRDFRRHVRGINPEAYLMGEIWWEEFPDKLLDPAPFLQGDVFDAVMNYRWYRSARHYLAGAPDTIRAAEFVDSLRRYDSTLREENASAMMNYTGGYDTPRILTSLFNKNKYKYQAKTHEDANYRIHRPDAETFRALRLLLIQQFTYRGAPHIYAGDEMGMWGADDPSSRKPLIWPDYDFEDETAHPLGKERPRDEVRFNEDLFAFYQRMIRMRKAHPVLMHGELEFLELPGAPDVLAYRRLAGEEEVLVLINARTRDAEVKVPTAAGLTYRDLLGGEVVTGLAKGLLLPARTARVYGRINE